MANALSFDDLSTVLNSIVKQATGQTALAATDTSSFVAQAQTALLSGYDTLATSISQVLSKTIFSVRPYNRKFGGLYADSVKWGNHVRKMTAIDKDFEADQRFALTEGASVDQYKVSKPEVLQTNFYGGQTYQKHLTIYRDQLDQAFTGPDQFGSFISMVLQNASDQIEQAHEDTARGAVANMIGAKVVGDTANVIHLVTEYNAWVGNSEALTLQELRTPDNYPAFIRWVYARMMTIADLMTERSVKYHLNLTTAEPAVYINRHTPYDRMKMYILSSEMNNIEAEVFSQTFHTDFLRMVDYERVNFWQSIGSGDQINLTPSYIDTAGVVKKGAATAKANVFGVLMDEEAVGYTMINEWSQNSPFNAAGGYYNQFWHFTDRYWNDMTENCVVFLLD